MGESGTVTVPNVLATRYAAPDLAEIKIDGSHHRTDIAAGV